MKKVFIFSILIVIFTIGFFLGTVADSRKKTSSFENVQEGISCSEKIRTIQNKLDLCREDRGEFISDSRYPYDFSSVEIYSEYFVDTQVFEVLYEYQGKTIIDQEIRGVLDEKEWIVHVWKYNGSFPLAPKLPEALEKKKWTNYPVFDGYENYGLHPRWIGAQFGNNAQTYTTAENIQFIRGYELTPKSIGVVTLSTFIPWKPAFVTISVIVQNDQFITKENDPALNKEKAVLQKIADSISLQLE